MTTKQMYSELAKIAGARCQSGETFSTANFITQEEIKKAQQSILALLDKLNMDRALRDFGLSPFAQRRVHEGAARNRRIRVRDESIQRMEHLVTTIDAFDQEPVSMLGRLTGMGQVTAETARGLASGVSPYPDRLRVGNPFSYPTPPPAAWQAFEAVRETSPESGTRGYHLEVPLPEPTTATQSSADETDGI